MISLKLFSTGKRYTARFNRANPDSIGANKPKTYKRDVLGRFTHFYHAKLDSRKLVKIDSEHWRLS